MERRQVKPYRVVHVRTGRVLDFERAEGVITHMLEIGGFDLPDHFLIYKSGKRWEYTADLVDVAALERALHAWRP